MKKELKEKGYKLTTNRITIINYIEGQEGLFSARELMQKLPSLDKVTIYRTLDLLVELDLIHPAFTNHGEIHFEKHGKKHHHHVVCTKCEKTSCIGCDFKDKKIKGFKNIHHSFVLTGLCIKCS